MNYVLYMDLTFNSKQYPILFEKKIRYILMILVKPSISNSLLSNRIVYFKFQLQIF